MKREAFAEQAARESVSLPVRPGKIGSAPFWNIESIRFIYAPAFGFAGIPGIKKYKFLAIDEYGSEHSFVADRADSALAPIWAAIPEGVVRLTVSALNGDGTDYAPVGARTFFKAASFPAQAPRAACSYKECTKKAFEYTMQQSFIRHWLEYGTPDPTYDLNIYPSKIVSSMASTMITFAEAYPECGETAMKVAVSAADWLMSITPRGEHPLKNIPPTYICDFRKRFGGMDEKTPNEEAGKKYGGTVMMIYPASAGSMYIKLASATGNKKYLDEAVNIGKFYLENVEENGSWYLVRSEKTGEPVADNFVAPMEGVVPFLTGLYESTGDECWKKLIDGAVKYTVENQLAGFNWEGQFEDTGTSAPYNNLSQYGPVGLVKYYTDFCRNDEASMKIAEELMRFVEDQFVVWSRVSKWREPFVMGDDYEDGSRWTVPAGLEQYRCYFPIDASAVHAASGFLALYKAGRGDIYLAKARALADSVTRVQHENGKIPTFWMHTKSAEDNFWFNCMFYACDILNEISAFDDVVFE